MPVSQKLLPIEIPRNQIERFCINHRIAKLSLFGSILRDDFTDESDVDFLVECYRSYYRIEKWT
jgi:predicted nucleotidyltransferase